MAVEPIYASMATKRVCAPLTPLTAFAAIEPGYSLRFAMLPPIEPDDVVREGEAEAMQAILGKAIACLI